MVHSFVCVNVHPKKSKTLSFVVSRIEIWTLTIRYPSYRVPAMMSYAGIIIFVFVLFFGFVLFCLFVFCFVFFFLLLFFFFFSIFFFIFTFALTEIIFDRGRAFPTRLHVCPAKTQISYKWLFSIKIYTFLSGYNNFWGPFLNHILSEIQL